MSDWRSIRMTEIDWRALKSHIGRSAQALRSMCHNYGGRDPDKYGLGSWRDMTLGEVADLGRAQILRHAGIGETALSGLQYVIDLAAAGKLPLLNGVAIDALRPTKEAAP